MNRADLKTGDAVRTPAGATGKVYSIGLKVRVRIATGKQAGQIRAFNAASLERL